MLDRANNQHKKEMVIKFGPKWSTFQTNLDI